MEVKRFSAARRGVKSLGDRHYLPIGFPFQRAALASNGWVRFMHETHARRLTRLVSAGFVWLTILIGLMLSDFLTRTKIPAPW
jgi:hypothetical protein